MFARFLQDVLKIKSPDLLGMAAAVAQSERSVMTYYD